VRNPLGQGCLETVVVGIGAVRPLVDELQIRELARKRTHAVGKIDLIDVTEKKQSFADITDIAKLQGEVVREGVLHAQVPTRNVRVFEIRVDRHEIARYRVIKCVLNVVYAGRYWV